VTAVAESLNVSSAATTSLEGLSTPPTSAADLKGISNSSSSVSADVRNDLMAQSLQSIRNNQNYIKPGASNDPEQVAALQSLMQDAFKKQGIDVNFNMQRGVYDAETQKAVAYFQENFSISMTDGSLVRVGPDTAEKGLATDKIVGPRTFAVIAKAAGREDLAPSFEEFKQITGGYWDLAQVPPGYDWMVSDLPWDLSDGGTAAAKDPGMAEGFYKWITGGSEEGLGKVATEITEDFRKAGLKVTPEAAQRIYAAIAVPETGSLNNLSLDDPQRFIRTRVDALRTGPAPSSAYGPVQITKSLAEGSLKQHPEAFGHDPELLNYVNRFVAQGRMMINHSNTNPAAARDDGPFGTGGPGLLSGERDRELYARMANILIGLELERAGGNRSAFIRNWRGADDRGYFQTFNKMYAALGNSSLEAAAS